MSDINQPVGNPDLLTAIEEIKKESTPDTQSAYFKAIKSAKFLSPTTINPQLSVDENGEIRLDVNTEIKVQSFIDANGDEYLPVYTDWTALKLWRDILDEQALITSYEDISQMVLNNSQMRGFIINPYSHNVMVLREGIAHINRGILLPWNFEERTFKKETKVKIGKPMNDPVALKAAVSKHLKHRKNVKKAYLARLEKDNEFSVLIVVDFKGEIRSTFDEIATVAVPLLQKGEALDMIPAESDFGKSVVQKFEPFYKRKIFGLF